MEYLRLDVISIWQALYVSSCHAFVVFIQYFGCDNLRPSFTFNFSPRWVIISIIWGPIFLNLLYYYNISTDALSWIPEKSILLQQQGDYFGLRLLEYLLLLLCFDRCSLRSFLFPGEVLLIYLEYSGDFRWKSVATTFSRYEPNRVAGRTNHMRGLAVISIRQLGKLIELA